MVCGVVDERFLKLIREGEVEQLGRMLKTDPSLANRGTAEGISVVLYALYNRQGEVAELFADLASNLSRFDCSSLGRRDELAKCLDSDGRALDAISADGFSALHLAAFFAQKDCVRELLSRGAGFDLQAQNPSLVTPLHSAVAAGDREVVELLLEAGASLHAQQKGGWTALHAAEYSGHQEIVELLIRKGAPQDIKADDGRLPADMRRES